MATFPHLVALSLVLLLAPAVHLIDPQVVPAGGDDSEHDDHFDLSFLDFFSDENTEDDKHLEQHIKEEIGLDNINVENMTESEKDWYYFKLHDYNEDYKLDGLEILKAWQHHYTEHVGSDTYDHTTGENATEVMKKQNDMFVEMVDMILNEQDLNYDGFLDYFEYITAKQKQEEEMKKHNEEEERKKAQQN